MNDFKFWRDTHENRGWEREKKKEKLTNTKLELRTPRAPPGRVCVVETYLTTPKKLVVNGGGVLDVRLLCTH
jgi:hypothetical protein